MTGPRLVKTIAEPWESGPPPGRFDDVANDAAPASVAVETTSHLRHESPADVVRRWRSEGKIERVATGFKTLDEACRGGLPLPWRVFTNGAPSAGKTAFEMVIARRFVSAGMAVGIHGIDEESDDLNIRIAQMAGFTIAECEDRDPIVLNAIEEALSELHIRFYGPDHTIESAAEDLAAWAKSLGKRAAFVIDSIQTSRSDAACLAKSQREVVEANVRAVRYVATTHRLMVLATSETNRGSYRNEEASDPGNDMASGKDSGAIEFSAQTLFVLRTPKGYPDIVNVRVPKNRRGARSGFEFWLRLNRERHELSECADPSIGDAAHDAQLRETKTIVVMKTETVKNAKIVAAAVRANPGCSERGLRAALRVAGHGWSVPKLEAAKLLLEGGVDGVRLVDRGEGQRNEWHLEASVAIGNGGVE